MLAWLANAVTGGLLDRLLGFAGKATDAIASTERAKIASQTTIAQEALKGSVEVSIADKAWWLTAAMKPAIFYLFLVHVGAIVLDTTFKLHLGVAKLPAPYDTMEANVIYMCVGLAGLMGLSRIIK